MNVDLFVGSDVREDVLGVLSDEEEEEDYGEDDTAEERDCESPLVSEEIKERLPERCDGCGN